LLGSRLANELDLYQILGIAPKSAANALPLVQISCGTLEFYESRNALESRSELQFGFASLVELSKHSWISFERLPALKRFHLCCVNRKEDEYD
jgi:hypothetical protein